MIARMASWTGVMLARAGAGALLTFGAARAMNLVTGGCTTLCNPWIGLPFGAVVGVIAFTVMSKDR